MGGSSSSVIITIKEITDRRTVESHIIKSQKMGSLGSFVSGIAHAFNNTLTAIAGQASYAKKLLNHPEVIAISLEEILRSTQNAGELVRNLLDFAEDSRTMSAREDLNHVVKDQMSLLKEVVGAGYELRYSSAKDTVKVECDSNLVGQAITNLVLNAAEAYSGNKGVVEVSIDVEEIGADVSMLYPGARPGTFARLRIRDYGTGMNPEVLAKACEPHFTTKQKSGHSGMGLAIVFAIARAHDGFLTVESHTEKGTTVSLYLPLHRESDSQQVQETSTSSKSEPITNVVGNQEKILVVEDEDNVRDLISMMLSSIGYDVTSCSNGNDALKECSKEDFDLVLVDMVLPKMNGSEVLDRIRKSDTKIKTIVMTGYGLSSDNLTNVDEVLPKPFDLDTLAERVRVTLDR